jgi:hypothetical protein
MLMERAVLLAPDPVARAAARRARRPEQSWMLRQPRPVRGSFARAVRGASDARRAQEIWLLRQTDAVRESYVREVLGADG